MKITKSLFLTTLFMGLFYFSSFAADPINDGDKYSKVTNQIAKLLEGMDISSIDHDETIKIDFMINSTGEIIVISTDNEKLDESLKSKLNYKKLQSKNLETFKTYTVPVKIKK
jgi:hypothetical protein